MKEQMLARAVDGLIQNMRHSIQNPTKANIDATAKLLEKALKDKKYKAVKAGLKNNTEYNRVFHEFKKAKQQVYPSKNKKNIVKAGLGVACFLGIAGIGGCALQQATNQKGNTPVEATEIKSFRPEPVADVEYDEVFDADVVQERIDRITNFLTRARELGYGEDLFTIDQLMDVYTILNLDSISTEEYRALGFGDQNPEIMMENFGDFGIAFGQALMISNSDAHLSLADLIADKQSAEAMRELEDTIYSYNDEKSDKKAIAQSFDNLLWSKTVQSQTVNNPTQLMGYYMGFYGRILTINNDEKDILSDVSQFKEIFGEEAYENMQEGEVDVKGCIIGTINGRQTQFAESYTDTKNVLTYFLQASKEYRDNPTYERNVKEEVYNTIKDVEVKTHVDWNYYRNQYSKFQDDDFYEKPFGGNLNKNELNNLQKDENGNPIIIGGQNGPSKEEQTDQKQNENQDALKTEASSAAVEKAKIDAKTGAYDPTVPEKYQSVSADYSYSYERAYKEYKAIYDLENSLKPTLPPNSGDDNLNPDPTPVPTPAPTPAPTPEATPAPEPPLDESGVDFGDDDKIITDKGDIIDSLPDDYDGPVLATDAVESLARYKMLLMGAQERINSLNNGTTAELTDQNTLKLTIQIPKSNNL